MLITDGGAWFYVTQPRFWSKLPPKRVAFHVARRGLIWLYQVCAKALRAPATNADFNEFGHDLALTLAVASQSEVFSVPKMPMELVEFVSNMMTKKGWVKT